MEEYIGNIWQLLPEEIVFFYEVEAKETTTAEEITKGNPETGLKDIQKYSK